MKNLVFILLLMSTACMQSRKGIQSQAEKIIFNPLDWCDTWEYDQCDSSTVHLVATLNYDENYMDFEVVKMPYQQTGLTLRLMAKRVNEGRWHYMKEMDYYSGSNRGSTTGLYLSEGQILRVKPDVGRIEDYRSWLLETESDGEYTLEKVGPGLGMQILTGDFSYGELDSEN